MEDKSVNHHKKFMLRRHKESEVCVEEGMKVDFIPGGGGEVRRWDEMHRDILVQIFHRVPIALLLPNMPYVCRSWLSSVLDAIFPLGTLRLGHWKTLPKDLWSNYLHFLEMALDTRPQIQWHTLKSPREVKLKEDAICYIAQRSPLLQHLYVWNPSQFQSYQKAFPYWKNLKSFVCCFFKREIIPLACELGTHCKNVSYLGLYGRIGADEASAVVESLPQLEYLTLEASSLTMEALLVFDSHKKLATLNLQHTLFVDRKFLPSFTHGKRNYSFRMLTRAVK